MDWLRASGSLMVSIPIAVTRKCEPVECSFKKLIIILLEWEDVYRESHKTFAFRIYRTPLFPRVSFFSSRPETTEEHIS